MVITAVALLALAGAPPKPTKELLDKGKTSFTTNCMACHGEKGHGDGPAAVALNPKPRNYTTDPFKQGDKPEDVFKTLQTGVPNTPMVGFGHLPEEERWALAFWVLELKKAGAPAAAAPAPAAPDKGKPAPAAAKK
jgi:mono/diheme cytochrome c family protein